MRVRETGGPPTLFHDGSEVEAGASSVVLDPEEVAHARTLRLRPGAPIQLTDGRGRRWAGRLETLDRRSATVSFGNPLETDPPPPFRLLVPVGNRERCLWLVEKAVEIGVSAIAFVEFERSRSVGDAGRSAGFIEKAARRARAALKQCGASTLPEIAEPRDFARVLDLREDGVDRWVGRADGDPVHDVARARRPGDGLVFMVGPEGGLTVDEEAACDHAGFRPVSLGPRVLRFETAAMVGLAVAAAALSSNARES